MDALDSQSAGDEPDTGAARPGTTTTAIRQPPPVCDEPHCHYCEGPETD